MKKYLLYTIAYDIKDTSPNRWMAKMLAASCLRCGFDGDILIFHNGNHLLFANGRANLREIRISEDDLPVESWRRTPHRLKFMLRHLVPSHDYDVVLFLDADSLVIRDPICIFDKCKDILYQPEHGLKIQRQQFNSYLTSLEMESLNIDGVNSGSFAIRGDIYQQVMSEWDSIDSILPLRGDEQHEQGAWNRLLIDSKWDTSPFDDGMIDFPFFPLCILESALADSVVPPLLRHLNSDRYWKATILHTLGPMPSEQRLAMTFGLFTARFFTDSHMNLLNILEP